MKHLLTLCLLVAAAAGLFAQPSISSSFNPQIGDFYKYHPVNTIISTGGGGANVTWNFGTIQITYNPIIGKYIHPSSTPYAGDFSVADVVFEDYFVAGTYHYYDVSTTKLEKIGYANSQLTAVYDDPQRIITYPFTYNSSFTDTYACTTMVGTMKFTKTGTWSVEGDGYGTLVLPSGSHSNILRLKIVNEYTDEFSGLDPYEYKITEYWWVDPSSRKPLMKVYKEWNSTMPNDTTVLTTVLEGVSGVDHPGKGATNLRLYPNPASEEVHLVFDLESAEEVHYELMTIDGKLIRSIDAAQAVAGTITESISLDGVKAGIYLLNVSIGNVSKVMKISVF